VDFAEKYLKLNARILPGEWRVHYYSAQLYQEAGRTESADSALRAGLEVSGSNSRVFAGALAQSYVRQGRTAEAAAVLEAEVARSPNDLEMALTLSEVHQQAGDLTAAVEALSAWLRRNPAHEYAQAVGQRVQQMQAASAGAPGTPFPAAPAGE
jgi:thioredoxin-like negative regulator of GroEL